jgi:hypothetical protein
MSDEQQEAKPTSDKVTPITRTWRLGGRITPTQRKEAKSLFIDALKSTHNVSAACDHAGVARKTVYQWREKDTLFADDWEEAVERTKDTARSSIYQRGILGWDEPVVSVGQVVYEYVPITDEQGLPKLDSKGKPMMRRGDPLTIHKWSDSLATAYARANLPEYKEKQDIDLTTHVGQMAEQAKDELLADLMATIKHDEDKNTAHSG